MKSYFFWKLTIDKKCAAFFRCSVAVAPIELQELYFVADPDLWPTQVQGEIYDLFPCRSLVVLVAQTVCKKKKS